MAPEPGLEGPWVPGVWSATQEAEVLLGPRAELSREHERLWK